MNRKQIQVEKRGQCRGEDRFIVIGLSSKKLTGYSLLRLLRETFGCGWLVGEFEGDIALFNTQLLRWYTNANQALNMIDKAIEQHKEGESEDLSKLIQIRSMFSGDQEFGLTV